YSNGVRALNNLSLEIPKGMFGLLGPNGAGKSTLMRTIATLQDADEGSLYFNEIDVLKQKQEIRKILGYLPQDFGLDPKAQAEDLLDYFAVLKGISNSKERKETVKYLLNQTNLYEKRKKKLGTFSGGMKQRFGIAQALIGDPKLLIVDEPTAGLDPSERVRFHNLLSEIGEQTVVILSTHIVDDVSELCSKMAIINKGELLFVGEPFKALEAMNGKVWKKLITKAELPAIKEHFHLLTSKLFIGKTEVRVFSEQSLDNGFSLADPNLEDVYFLNITGGNE
ncbi:MAG: ABC transporter ATP-binding protein, partial [Candidatus Cloacimonetes bacterium]|nr:ABC transporter ATP-binding protein [Candidatus Cloacimonadota bacterium]